MVGSLLGGGDGGAAPTPAAALPQEQGLGIPRELVAQLLAQLPPEKLVEMLRAAG